MKNYSKLASKYGVIGSYMDTRNYIGEYKINRESKYVKINYMTGWYEIEELQEDTEEKLNQQMRDQLREMQYRLDPKIDSRIRWQGSLLFLYGLNTVLQFSVGHPFAGTCWLLGAGIYFGQSYFPYKLKKEMNLVSWIIDNKEYVNQVIKTEVERKMPETTETNTMIPVKKDYPTGLVPYSENLYEEGINLCNIDELKVKDLRKLKKKATKLRGESYV